MTKKTNNNGLTTEAENRRRSILMLERWLEELEQTYDNRLETSIKDEN